MSKVATMTPRNSREFAQHMMFRLGLSARGLSRAIRVSPATICLWVKDKEFISIEHWKLIFNYLESCEHEESQELLKLAKRAAIKEYESRLGLGVA